MHPQTKSLNIRYCLIHLFYWIAYGTLISFASVYLLDQGLSNSVIGFILAGGNILAVVVQPIVATYMDCHPTFSVKNYLAVLFIISFALSLVLQYIVVPTIVLSILMALLLTIYLSANPLINALSFRLERDNILINFGLARGIGSFVYAVACVILGIVVERAGTVHLRLYEAVVYLILIVLMFTFRDPSPEALAAYQTRKGAVTSQNNTSLIAFYGRYKAFSFFVLGSILVFFAHSLVAYFMIQVISRIGGNNANMGTACSIGAFAESFIMMFYIKINRKISSYHLLRFTAIMFAIKQVVTMLAASVPMFYFSQALQFGGYGLFIPASAAYVNCLMKEGDLMRGLTMIAIAPTIGNIFASFIGGVLLDSIGVPGVLIVGSIFSVVGAAIMFFVSGAKSMNIPSLARQ